MQVLISSEGFSDRIDEDLINNLAIFVMDKLDLPENTELSVSFVSNEDIAALNEAYRGKQGPTDVLSFECDNIDDEFPGLDCELDYTLGDIMIAPDVAFVQSQELGESFEAEISLLLVHGILHLCGYDHIEDDEALIMEGKQKELLSLWNIANSGDVN